MMSDKYYELAKRYCREKCVFGLDKCINCQVYMFTMWLDDLESEE